MSSMFPWLYPLKMFTAGLKGVWIMRKVLYLIQEVNAMKQLIAVLIFVVVVVALGSSAGAFTTSEKVISANDLIAIARVPAGGMTADQRIDRVNERLAYIYGYEPLDPGHIRAVKFGNDRIIKVGRSTLITVTARDAKANNTTVAGLTNVWLRAARAAIPQARPTPSIPG